MTLTMVSAAINADSAVTVTFGDYEKVTGAVVGLRSNIATAVATKISIATNVVTVTPAATAGTGFYDVIADCI